MVNNERRSQLIVGLLIVLHVAANLLWLSWDHTPPAWDQAFHLKAVVNSHYFLQGQFWGSFSQLIQSYYAYPPLMYWLSGLISLLTGLNLTVITFFNTVVFALALIGMYKLARNLTQSTAALWVTVIFSFFPVIYDASRNFLLDIPLLALVTWSLYFYFKSNYLTNRRYSLFWVLTLIGAALTKLNGFLYFLPMILFSLYQSAKKRDWRAVYHLSGGFLIYLLFVGWWYFLNRANIQAYITGLAGQGEPLTDPSGLLNLTNWVHYFKLFFLHQFSPIPTVILLISLVGWPYLGIKGNKRNFLLFYLLLNYLLFTLIKNKDFRFTFPLLPVIALLAASNLQYAPRLLRWILVLFLSFYFLNNSFGWPIKKDFVISAPTYIMGNVDWIALNNYPVRSPQIVNYPNNSIVSDLNQLTQNKPRQRVLVLIDQAEVNDSTLQLYQAQENKYFYDLSSLKNLKQFDNQQSIVRELNNYDFYLVPEMNSEPAPFYAIYLPALKQARNWIWRHQEELNLVSSYPYQTKKLYLFAR